MLFSVRYSLSDIFSRWGGEIKQMQAGRAITLCLPFLRNLLIPNIVK